MKSCYCALLSVAVCVEIRCYFWSNLRRDVSPVHTYMFDNYPTLT